VSNLEKVLKNIDDTLKTVRFALSDLNNAHPERRDAAIRNIITFGRSVTFAIQKLKTHVEGFDDWYKPKQREMQDNILFKFLNELRNEIIHEGKLEISQDIHVKNFNTILLQYVPQPPNTISFFIGDEHGASGWLVENDGVREKYYFSIPEEFVQIKLMFNNLPEELKNEQKSINQYCQIYYDYLFNLVKETKEKFA